MVDDKKLAYVAGLFDGEGCITTINNGTSLSINICNTVIEPLEFVKRLFGGSIYTQKSDNIKHKLLHRWAISGEAASEILQCLLPYLIIRKERAVLGIKFVSTFGQQEKINIALELKRMNRSGRTIEEYYKI